MTHNHARAQQHKRRNSKKFMMSSLVRALIINESINITLTRAKALRMVIEPLITLAKKAYNEQDKLDRVVHFKRLAFGRLKDRMLVTKLFSEIAPRYVDRKGGYVSLIKTHVRMSDSTPMAQVSLIV